MIATTLSEQVLFSTIIIISGESQGTGFIYKTPSGNYVVISNRHVAEKTDKFNLSISSISQDIETNLHLKSGKIANVKGKVTWYLHPTEDLAFFDFTSFTTPLLGSLMGDKFEWLSVDASLIPSQVQLDNLSTLEKVTIAGCPNQQYDAVHNFPLLRTGYTSSHPAIDYNGKKRGTFDVHNVPGSSGSPVYILNEGYYYDKSGVLMASDRIYLLGVATAMQIRLNKDIYNEVVWVDSNTNSQITIYQNTNLVSKENIGIGEYVKSSEILYFNSIFANLGI